MRNNLVQLYKFVDKIISIYSRRYLHNNYINFSVYGRHGYSKRDHCLLSIKVFVDKSHLKNITLSITENCNTEMQNVRL